MPANQARSGFGSQFQIEDAVGSGTFVTLADNVSITAPEQRLDTEDATHMASPNGAEEVIATILRTGEATANLHYVPGDTTHGHLLTAQTNKELRAFRIISPSGTRRLAFSAFVVSIGAEIPHDNKMTRSVSIKPSGLVVEEANP